MGTKGKEIVQVDIKELLSLLNKAYADEWLAYYQYWIGSKLVTGMMRGAVAAELAEHASDELKHAGMLAARIIQLGGTPLVSPQEWFKQTNCGYDSPDNPVVGEILRQNIKGEQCAIDVYNKLISFVQGKDLITYNLAVEILEDEVEHEEDLESLVQDMSVKG